MFCLDPNNAHIYSVTDTTVEDPKIQELQKELERFMLNGQADMLEFPSSLNSHDRLIVHEVQFLRHLTIYTLIVQVLHRLPNISIIITTFTSFHSIM